MTLFFYALAIMVIGLLLVAVARKPEVLQAIHPMFVDMASHLNSRRAKHAYRGFYLLFRALAKLAMLFLSGFLVVLGSRRTADKEKVLNNGSIWERDVTGFWYSFGADKDSTRPPQL